MSDAPPSDEAVASPDHAPCGLMRTEPDGTFTWVNRTFCNWVGRSAEELVGKLRFQELLTMGGRIFHQTHWAPLLQMQGSLSEVKLELKTADGGVVPMVLNAIRYEQRGVVTHHLAAFIARDRDKYERELVQSRARLQALVEQSARLELEAKDRALLAEQMIGIVSHDLRNPLSSIRMGVHILEAGTLTANERNVLVRMGRSVDRAGRLIADLLDFAQARLAGGLAVSLKPVADLHQTIAETVDELSVIYPSRKLTHVRTGQGPCTADPNRLAQLLGNLVSNAMAYGAPETRVLVTSEIAETTCSVSVHNHGKPIPEELQAGLFEPLARGASGSNANRSIGLGLFIVGQIAAAHGGRATLQSSSQEGTTFRVEFPR